MWARRPKGKGRWQPCSQPRFCVHLEGAPADSGFCVAIEVCDPDGNPVILHQRADGGYGQNSKRA